MSLVVLQSIEILVSLVAYITFVWLLLFHSYCARISCVCIGIEDRESAITILLESLVLVAMGFVIFETIGVAIGFV